MGKAPPLVNRPAETADLPANHPTAKADLLENRLKGKVYRPEIQTATAPRRPATANHRPEKAYRRSATASKHYRTNRRPASAVDWNTPQRSQVG
jgi:hypothetical protein